MLSMSKFLGVYELIHAVSPVYHNLTDTDARSVIETTVGAAIFYLPKSKEKLWTGMISEAALQQNKRCEDHIYPRKITAIELLTHVPQSLPQFEQLYWNKYGKYHYVTSEENRMLVKYQKTGEFTSPEEAYESCGIKLIRLG